MMFLFPKRKKVVRHRFGVSLLLTASVVEDAYRHLNGTARQFYRTVADIKHYLLDCNKKEQTQSHRIRSVKYIVITLFDYYESPYQGTRKHLSNQQGQFQGHQQC